MPQSDPFPDQNVKLPEPKSDHRDAAESDHIDEDSSLHDQLLSSHLIRRNGQTLFYKMCEGHRFDLRFLHAFRADLSIRKSSSFLPPLIAATSQRGFAPRPAQVSPDGPRYFGGTFLPLKALPPPPTTLAPPTTAIALSILSNRVSISARRSKSISSTHFRRSISASTLISDRFTLAIMISGEKAELSVRL